MNLDLQQYLRLQSTPYERRGSSIELVEASKSRSVPARYEKLLYHPFGILMYSCSAPSYSSRQSAFRADDDEDPLIKATRDGALCSRASKSMDGVVRHEVSCHSSTTVSRTKKCSWSGWRFGVAMSAALASLVSRTCPTRLNVPAQKVDPPQLLLMNVLFVAICSASYVFKGGIGTLFDGDCHYVESTAVWLHVAINILFSLLLGASNYTMQVLCSPTRSDIDSAHANGDWVDIGVPGIRNIRGKIARRRATMWWILGLSSVPIHLLYVNPSELPPLSFD